MPTRGRPRTYATHAEKMRAYRQRLKDRVPPPLPPLPAGPYRVVYADPPWEAFGLNLFSGGQRRYVPGERPAPWSLETLCDLPVKSRLDFATALLGLWVPPPLLPEGLEVVTAWGFRYRRLVVWDRMQTIFGGLPHGEPVLFLVCTRGSTSLYGWGRLPSVQRLGATPDEAKPDSFRQAIEGLEPKGRRLELFARHEVPGWDVWPTDAQAAAYQLSAEKRGVVLALPASERGTAALALAHGTRSPQS